MICAHCGDSIERHNGSWVHFATGWKMCDPSEPLTVAEPHAACQPGPA
jgi:hypothetical protein